MKTAIVLGTFDGLHAGHRAVIDKAQGFYSIAVTFDTPPKSVITNEPQLLILPNERKKRLHELGINQVEMQHFESVKNLDATQYLEQLVKKYNPDRIVCGFNYRFGYKALGDTDLLKRFCQKNGIEFICVPAVKCGENVVSSTFIRSLVREGKTEEASKQIYGGFSFDGVVLHGDARGRVLGFPTANQNYPSEMIRVKNGVYISRVTIDDVEYKAITNVGIRPTFKTEQVACETFIKDFSGDIYGKVMKTQLLRFVRDEQKFSSTEELKNAILNDVKLLD